MEYKGNILKEFRKNYIIIVEKKVVEKAVKKVNIPPVEVKHSKSIVFTITAYDLSYNSTQKSRGDSSFGVTKSGISLKNHNWKSVRIVATDLRVIPLGTKLLIKFTDKKHQKYSGVYTSADCGSAIRGNRLDLFIEDGNGKVSKEALNFGIAHANVTILEN